MIGAGMLGAFVAASSPLKSLTHSWMFWDRSGSKWWVRTQRGRFDLLRSIDGVVAWFDIGQIKDFAGDGRQPVTFHMMAGFTVMVDVDYRLPVEEPPTPDSGPGISDDDAEHAAIARRLDVYVAHPYAEDAPA